MMGEGISDKSYVYLQKDLARWEMDEEGSNLPAYKIRG